MCATKKAGLSSILVVVVLLALCVSAEAQQSAKVRRIGVLRGDSSPNLSVETFQQAMRDLGYLEGKNIVIEYRYAEGKVDRLPDLAEELVRLNVDVIWAAGPAVSPAKNAAKTNPHRHIECWRPCRIRASRQPGAAWWAHYGIFQCQVGRTSHSPALPRLTRLRNS